VTRSQQNSTRRLSLADDVTSRRRRQNSVLSDQQLLDAIRSSDLGDYLHDLLVVVTSVTADDQERIPSSLGDALQQGRNEVLGVVRLLENDDLLAETGAVVIDQLLHFVFAQESCLLTFQASGPLFAGRQLAQALTPHKAQPRKKLNLPYGLVGTAVIETLMTKSTQQLTKNEAQIDGLVMES
jgi:hypothetical protein